MLLRFTVENYLSFRDEVSLSFVGTRLKGGPEHRFAFDAPGLQHGVLPVIGVVGANASGKSNLLHALRLMAAHVGQSFTGLKPGQPIRHKPFALAAQSASRPTTFTLDFVVDGVRYNYGFRFNAVRFTEEWLTAFPKRKPQLWFHRTASNAQQDGTEHYRWGAALKGSKHTISEATRPNSLFLSAAAQHNHAQLTPLYRWFASSLKWDAGAKGDGVPMFFEGSAILEPHCAALVKRLLQLADLGVSDFEVAEDERFLEQFRELVAAPQLPAEAREQFQAVLDQPPPQIIRLAHTGENEASVTFEPEQESQGTHSLLQHLNHALAALLNGHLLLVDELDANLHPHLAATLIDLFTHPGANPHGAQLLFTAHDTSLLDHLRRDEVLFTEKGLDGHTTAIPLSEYDTRVRDDIVKAYQQGRFGAVPVLGDFAAAVAALHREM